MIFHSYFAEAEITGLIDDATWREVDISSLMQDTSAKAVCIRGIRANPAGTYQVGVRSVGQTLTFTTKVSQNNYFETLIGLAGGTSIEYRIPVGDKARLFVTGEVHAPAVIHPVDLVRNLDEPSGGWGDWITLAPTPIGGDTLSDIQAVLLRTIVAATTATFGVREKDQVLVVPYAADLSLGHHWWLVGLNANGLFEVSTTGKAGFDNEDVFFFEVGYIKKTGHNLYIEKVPWLYNAWGWPTTSGWETADFTVPPDPIEADPLPPGVATVGGRWEAGNATGPARHKAATAPNPPRPGVLKNSVATQMVSLDVDRRCEYRLTRSTTVFRLHWHELRDYSGAGVRRLNDDERLSANLSVPGTATLRLFSRKTVKTSAVSSRALTSIRGIKVEPHFSLGFRKKKSASTRKLVSNIKVSAELSAAASTSARIAAKKHTGAKLVSNTGASIRRLIAAEATSSSLGIKEWQIDRA
jgi:hypothetical protein